MEKSCSGTFMKALPGTFTDHCSADKGEKQTVITSLRMKAEFPLLSLHHFYRNY